MFKNTILYRVTGLLQDAAEIEDGLHASIFRPCGPTQAQSVGWVPPRGQEHGALLESVGGQWILRLMVESKKVPGDVLDRAVLAEVARIEDATGRKPGKKERKDIKENALLALLPTAFPTRAAIWVWVDPQADRMAIDASSQGKADLVTEALIGSIEGLSLAYINTQTTPAAAMSHWLATKVAPQGFTVDRECELKAYDESKAVVRYGHHSLDTDEVVQHITMGKVPTRLAMTWKHRVSFVVTDAMTLKKLDILDVVAKATTAYEDTFDADVAIFTGEMQNLIPDLIDALGGVVQVDREVVDASLPKVRPAAKLDSMLREDALTATVEDNTGAVQAQLGDGPDPLIDAAKTIVVEHNKASISLVQRHLKIGYNRAARLLETLEGIGAVSAMQSNGARTVLAQ